MKTVKCACETCNGRRIHWQEPDTMRQTQLVEVSDDFDETSEKAFCSIECAIYAGYLTNNAAKAADGVIIDGHCWIKDPSGGKDKRFAKLYK